MARERLEPVVGLDFGLLVSRLTTAFAMLASSFGPPRSSRPAPRDSDAWSKVDVELCFDDLTPEGTEAERKYSHVLVVQETADACEPRVGLPDHESVYDFVGRVVFENVDIKLWNMDVSLATATTDESNVRHYDWSHKHLPPGVSLVHRDVREHDDSADDEHVSEGVTFARQHVEIKERPKMQDGKLDTWEGAVLLLMFTSRHPHCDLEGTAAVSNEVWDAVHSAVMGLPEGVRVRIRSPSGDKLGGCIENVFQAPPRTIAPLIPKSSATVQLWDRTNREHFYAMKSGRFVATDPRASCSIKLCFNVFPRRSLRETRLKVSCAVFMNHAVMKAEQSRGLVDSLWVKPAQLWDEHNLAPITRSDERDRSTADVDPSAAALEDTRDALGLCVRVRKRPAPGPSAPSLDDDDVGDDVAAIIAGDALGNDAGDDRYLADFPRDVYVPHEVKVYFVDDDVLSRGVPESTDEDPGFRLPPKLFHARGTRLPRQLRDRMIGLALEGALKDLKRQDRYGFIGNDERERLKVCDAVIAAATGILEAAGPERAPEFFSQIQRMVDERPDLDWKKAFERKLRATAFGEIS